MSALESLDRYLKELERKMRLAAWTRGVAALAFSALAATGLLVSYTNASAFAERDVLIARFVLFLVLALALTFGIVLPLLQVNRRRAARRAENVLPFGDRLLTVVEHRNESDPFLELIAADALPVAAANGTAAIVPSRQLILMGALAVVGVGRPGLTEKSRLGRLGSVGRCLAHRPDGAAPQAHRRLRRLGRARPGFGGSRCQAVHHGAV